MSEKKYVAYVGSYTHGSSRQGIHVYDVDVENGTLTERSSVEVSNASPHGCFQRMVSIFILSRMRVLQYLNVIKMVICHVSTV